MRRVVSFIAALTVALPLSVLAQADRAALQQQLDQINKEIEANQGQLESKAKERTTLERDLSILDSKIDSAQLGIKARNLTMRQLLSNIGDKQENISRLDSKVVQGQRSIAQMLRQTRVLDDASVVEMALANSFETFMKEIDNFDSIHRELSTSFQTMTSQRDDLSESKRALEEQHQEEQDLLQIQERQQFTLKSTEKEKKVLVTDAKGQESIYQKIITSKKQTAAQIRAALFSLRDSNSVSFGDMYKYAVEAGQKTGVRPVLIMSILSEESNLGQNIGKGNWKSDMHPTRDAPVFQEICSELGLDPDTQPVSKKPWYGWGGAMGPAQFIPSTWKLYKDRISAMTQQAPPSPFNPRTATFATAILMMDNGADAQTPKAERLAAQRYLAGWKNASKPAYAFYGDEVMDIIAKLEPQIKILEGN